MEISNCVSLLGVLTMLSYMTASLQEENLGPTSDEPFTQNPNILTEDTSVPVSGDDANRTTGNDRNVTDDPRASESMGTSTNGCRDGSSSNGNTTSQTSCSDIPEDNSQDPESAHSTTQTTEPWTSTEESITTTSTQAPNDPETIAAVRQRMEQAGLMPLAMVGVVLNVLTLWVWQADETYNATTFLFKYLAFWDSLCLLTFVLFVSKLDDLLSKVALPVSNIAQRVSVHTTLLVSVARWLAVSRPLHVRSLLSMTRVRLACLGLLLWCMAVEGLFLYSSYGLIDRQTSWTLYYMQRVVGLALPLVLMLIFNVLLIVQSRKSRKDLGQTNLQQQTEARHRLTLAVVCISVSCLISYPISVLAETITNVHCYQGNVYQCDRFFVYCVKYVTFILQIINLCINFFFYLVFVSRFRQMLALRVRRCGPGSCCAAVAAAVDKPQTSVQLVERSVTRSSDGPL